MKSWIITNDERFFYGPMYCELIDKCSKHIGGIIILPPIVRINNFDNFLEEIKYFFGFLGLKGFFYLIYLWIKSFIFGYGNIENCSKKNNIKIYHLDQLESCEKILLKYKPKLIISTVNKLVKKKLLNLSNKGWANIHCGDLPRYAGLNALFWSMYYAEKNLSVSIHLMDEKFDSGNLIKQKKILNDGAPYFIQLSNLLNLATNELVDLLNDIDKSLKTSWINNKSKRTYFSKPKAKDGKEFRKNGGRFI